MMKFENIITALGIISGRDAIAVDKHNLLNNKHLELECSVDADLCSECNIDSDFVKIKIMFNNIIMLKIQSDEFHYYNEFIQLADKNNIDYSSVIEVIDSELLSRNPICSSNGVLHHYIISAYDSIIEVVCSSIRIDLL